MYWAKYAFLLQNLKQNCEVNMFLWPIYVRRHFCARFHHFACFMWSFKRCNEARQQEPLLNVMQVPNTVLVT